MGSLLHCHECQCLIIITLCSVFDFCVSGGMIAPLVGGMLLMIDRTVPVYTSVVVFVIAGICVLFLKEREGHGMSKSGERVVVH